MRIKNIHIYGFGKWIDQKWDLTDKRLDLFLGGNESGKSTLMAFIHAIFFGFPTKRENQYIPRETDRYGGGILLDISPYKNIFVERIAGKTQKGKLTVQYPDGRSGDENDLQSLLKGMDMTTFKGVFHFDLEGLQGMKDLTPKELSRYLYDAGMMGANKLSSLEKTIEQESDRLFKPKGKKTTINEMANQLAEMKQSVKKWEERLDEYENVQKNVQKNEDLLTKISSEQVVLQEKWRKNEKQLSLSPLIRDWYALKLQHDQVQKISKFPLDGIQRLNQLKERLSEKEARLSHEKGQVDTLIDQQQSLYFDELPSTIKLEMTEVIEEIPLYKNMKEEEKQLEFDERELRNQQLKIEKDWKPFERDVFMATNVNGYILEKYEQLKSKWQSLQTKNERLNEEKKKLDREQEMTVNQLENDKKQLLSTSEIKELESKVMQGKNSATLEQHKSLLVDQFDWLKKDREEKEKRGQATTKALFVTSIVLIIIAIMRIFAMDIVSFTILLMVSSIMFFILLKIKNLRKQEDGKLQEKLTKLRDNIDSMKKQQSKDFNDEHVEKLLKHHQDIKFKVDSIKQKNIYIQDKLNQWRDDWNEVQEEWITFDKQLQDWCVVGALPEGRDVLFYDRFLPSVKEWKQLDSKAASISKKKEQIIKMRSNYENKVIRIATKLSLHNNQQSSIEDLVKKLRQHLDFVNDQKEKQQRLNDKLETHKNILLETKEEKKLLKNELENLLLYAGVEEEEAFREKAELFKQQNELEEKLSEWNLQIVSSIPNEVERTQFIEDIINEQKDLTVVKETIDQQINKLDQEKNDLLHNNAQLKIELLQLEEEGTYEEQLQRYMTLKEKMNAKGKEWAIYKTSQYMITKVKAIYEKERQPKVMKRAQTIFTELTSNKYCYLFAPLGEERFIVERDDGQRFNPSDLSRGTCELLYLSIRLALAIEDSIKTDYPLFLDETFVNMDKGRRTSVIKLLIDLSRYRQILLFTCHEHIKEEFISMGSQETSFHSLTLSQ
ncbi:ATP-binding protein [Salipaludibacillus daqingensis]|uniref:ATP-binding protein n=1 Tax=Salipaludibacillus daqingensis TaxID=3041001 RepID=UPI002476A919|nr:AAA family ATPase [Salipaludibacillus daqingensis]